MIKNVPSFLAAILGLDIEMIFCTCVVGYSNINLGLFFQERTNNLKA